MLALATAPDSVACCHLVIAMPGLFPNKIWNRGMVWFGVDLKGHSVAPPAIGRDTFH